jgi:hypothetical protein
MAHQANRGLFCRRQNIVGSRDQGAVRLTNHRIGFDRIGAHLGGPGR